MAGSPLVEAMGTAGGWDSLDLTHTDQLDDDHKRQVLDLANAYRDTFAGPSGTFILAEMVELYFSPRVAMPGDDMIAIGIRQGQQDVIRRILHLIHVARTGAINPQQESNP